MVVRDNLEMYWFDPENSFSNKKQHYLRETNAIFFMIEPKIQLKINKVFVNQVEESGRLTVNEYSYI